MSVELNFDPSQYQPMKEREPVPNGQYRAQIIESEMKRTKKGDGHGLNLTWQIIEGEYKGQYIWNQLNLDNPNQQAVDIAQRELTSICLAAGVGALRNSAQLHDKPVLITVRIEQKDQKYAPKNKITKYERDPAVGGVVAGSVAPAAPAAAASGPSWAQPRKSA